MRCSVTSYILWLVFLAVAVSVPVSAQEGVVGSVLAGKLIKPKVGQWAWYDLTDTSTGRHLALRQAIVGAEKVKRRNGYWVEIEIAPDVGHETVYKMLVTGPASDPKHVHRVIVRRGLSAAYEMPLDGADEAEQAPKPDRKSMGMTSIATPAGVIEAEHFNLTHNGRTSEVWTNDEVRPMGVVRMVSPDGELLLRAYGEGGEEAKSIIDAPRAKGAAPKVEVRVGEPEQAPATPEE